VAATTAVSSTNRRSEGGKADAIAADVDAVVLLRGPAIVNGNDLVFPGTPTAPEIAAAHTALAAAGILTLTLENIPFKPATLSGSGLFSDRGVRSRTVVIESRDGTLSLILFTPAEWERRRGMRLRFIYRRNGPSLLVAEKARINTRGRAVASRSKTGRGQVSAPIFLLVPQVKLGKRLDLARDAEKVARSVPGLIVQKWVEG